MHYARLPIVLVLLTACTVQQPRQDLPDYMARIPWYQTQYASDPANREVQGWEEYRLWAIRFYEGSYLYARGWTQTIDEISSTVAAEERDAVRARMVALGKRISAEWAKSNDQRVITTRHMSLWGDALREAVERGEIPGLLDRVEADVEALLGGAMMASDITRGRYYAVDRGDFFAF